MNVIVTGGCGFIGSNFIYHILNKEDISRIINIDKQTYAGLGRNLEHMGIINNPRYTFYKEDITDYRRMNEIFSEERPEIVVNFAAESHVDRSINESADFIKANILGTHSLLEATRNSGLGLFVQISTDEVYGSLEKESPSSKETDRLCPRSPYSASKASAENLVQAYFHTYKLPILITRSSNNFGPYQFPEKIIPLFITNLIDRKKVPLMYSEENPGLNVRDWIHVEDNCDAIWYLIQHGKIGGIYNIGGENEIANITLTRFLLSNFGFGEEMIEFIPHRAGHDFRYSLDTDKLMSTGFKRKYKNSKQGFEETIRWYKENESWWRPLKK